MRHRPGTDGLAPAADDLMVEIGPGQGAMTSLLLEQLNALHAVELDRDLVALLQKKFGTGKLLIHCWYSLVEL